jgi:hypothetical protein
MNATLPKIAVGYIRGHEVTGRFMECLLDLIWYDEDTWQVLGRRIVPVMCAHYLAVGRNELVKKMLRLVPEDVSVFVILDTDNTFKPAQIMELAAAVDPVERPVVSALYWACDNLGEQVRPLVLRRRADGELTVDWDYPADQLIEVDVVGMGATAVHRRVFQDLQTEIGERWFDFDESPKGNFMPEDNAFCRRVQEMLGAKIHLHTGIQVGHVKWFEIGKRDERRKLV